jgi:hypothetical protein
MRPPFSVTPSKKIDLSLIESLGNATSSKMALCSASVEELL